MNPPAEQPGQGRHESVTTDPGIPAEVMTIRPRLVSAWPKLAWVARVEEGSRAIEVFHGPMVETADDWLAEAVWAGRFSCGDFDQTDLVYGSGVRCRGDKAIFVTPGAGVGCLWHVRRCGVLHVSNSLPALLAMAGLSLCEDYKGYTVDLMNVEIQGIYGCVKSIPVREGKVRLTYFSNLLYDGKNLAEVEKPGLQRRFDCYADYRGFLSETARALGANCRDEARRNKVAGLAGISSGYDSPACAVIAREAGFTRTATIVNSTSFWRGSDSGEAIAKRLGMSCQVCRSRPRHYRSEIEIFSTTGRDAGFNLTVFDYPQPLCLFFDGSYGDKVWDRLPHDLSNPLGDMDAALGEFRLAEGIFHTVVPWWGIRQANQINALGAAGEMAPWALGTDYDRPVARRIVEEAGIERGTFAVRKKNTSSNSPFRWPHSRRARAGFAAYLARRGLRAMPSWIIRLFRAVTIADILIQRNVLSRLGLRRRRWPLRHTRANSLLFHWANAELRKSYEDGIRAARQCPAGIPDRRGDRT